jgi:SAM-dependent methyltransferase
VYRRVLELCRCPSCGGELRLTAKSLSGDGEIESGLLSCDGDHWFPVVRGVPRLLDGALALHWPALAASVAQRDPELRRRLGRSARPGATGETAIGDRRTREHFDRQWAEHDPGARTWGLDLAERVWSSFIDPVGLPLAELAGKIVLDAGCGGGSQSVAYTALDVEVIAIDLSTGVDKGHAYRAVPAGARPERVHFVQADLQQPPLPPESIDIILSEGTLYHTPDTHETFRRLAELLKPGGSFYVTLFKYERVVTPVLIGVRALTTRVPTPAFAWLARRATAPYSAARRAATSLGIRSYAPLEPSEAAVALMDLLGPPRAHYHSVEEVLGWYRAAGFDEVRVTHEARRSFGVCGRRAGGRHTASESLDEHAVYAVAAERGDS